MILPHLSFSLKRQISITHKYTGASAPTFSSLSWRIRLHSCTVAVVAYLNLQDWFSPSAAGGGYFCQLRLVRPYRLERTTANEFTSVLFSRQTEQHQKTSWQKKNRSQQQIHQRIKVMNHWNADKTFLLVIFVTVEMQLDRLMAGNQWTVAVNSSHQVTTILL